MVTNKGSTRRLEQPAEQQVTITGTRTVNADLHNHLRTSSNMKGLFNQTIDKAQERLGPGGMIALVNFEDSRYERFFEEPGYERTTRLRCGLYVPEKDIFVVKGQEIATQDGHLLVLGLNRGAHIKSHRSLPDTIAEAQLNGGIIIADHPFYNEGTMPFFCRSPLKDHFPHLQSIDAIEGYNGSAELYIPGKTREGANEQAMRFHTINQGRYPDLGFISVSDGHSLYELGRSYTTIQMPSYGEIRTSEMLRTHLRKAVRKSRPENCVMKSAKLGALKHIADLAAIIALRKFGVELK